MRLKKILICCLLPPAVLAGCGDYSNHVLEEDLAFLTAVPARAVLELRVADDSPRRATLATDASALASVQQAVLGQPADWYLFTLVITLDINRSVFGFLSLADLVTSFPPTRRLPDRRVWGPWPSRETPHSMWRFVMSRNHGAEGGTNYDLSLQVRERLDNDTRGEDEGWIHCLAGNVTPDRQRIRRGIGTLVADAEACNRFENTGERGTATVTFDTSPDADNPAGKTDLTIAFDGFVSRDMLDRNPDPQPLNATYTYLERGDRSGTFRFDLWTDLSNGEDPARIAPEHVILVVQWTSGGAGRADSHWTDGDLGAIELVIHECWDPAHERVYYQDSLGMSPTEGDPANCVLPPADFD